MSKSVSYLIVAVVVGTIAYALGQQHAWQPTNTHASEQQLPPQFPADSKTKDQAKPKLDASPEERVNVGVYERANRSVVHITTRTVELDDFLLLSRPRQGSGSGTVLDKKGHILTNFHVVEGDQRFRRIGVTLYDGSVYEGELVGSDPNNDLVVLKIKAPKEKLHPITWGDSSKLLVGLRVFAIGNPFGLERTLTTGIISSLNRSLRSENNRLIRGIIQTDAAINPGNSGGPLLNRRGELVGITTAIIGQAAQNSGIGLAIPSNTAKRVVDELVRFGRVIRPDSGIFSVYELDHGLRIGRLVPDGPAEKAGLRGPKEIVVRRSGIIFRGLDHSKADIIVAVDGNQVTKFDDLLTYVESKRPGDRIVVTVLRNGERVDVPVTLVQSKS